MARYLIVTEDADLVHITETEAKHIVAAIESLDLEDGESVKVYRMAGPPRKVTVKTETVRKLNIE